MNIEEALRWVDNNCYDEATVNRLRSRKVARTLSDEVERLRNQLEAGRNVVNLGINLMTTEQVEQGGFVAGLLERLAEAPRWRDIAEEQPQEAQEVLFVRGGKTVHGAWIGGIFWHSNQKMAAAQWMPLPEPPKVGDGRTATKGHNAKVTGAEGVRVD